jgi:hypothetical protein
MCNTPVYLLIRDEMEQHLYQFYNFFYWGDRERLALQPLPAEAALELLETCIEKFGLSRSKRPVSKGYGFLSCSIGASRCERLHADHAHLSKPNRVLGPYTACIGIPIRQLSRIGPARLMTRRSRT